MIEALLEYGALAGSAVLELRLCVDCGDAATRLTSESAATAVLAYEH